MNQTQTIERSIEQLWLAAYRTRMSPFIMKAIGIAEAQAALERQAASRRPISTACGAGKTNGGMHRYSGRGAGGTRY